MTKELDLRIGDCIESMRELPEQCVNTCVTSPPYFGLRDYGNDGQIGLEATPDEFVAKLVEVFREVKRVLRDDGTMWLNLGDSYSGGGTGGHIDNKASVKEKAPSCNKVVGLKPKDLIGIPWRVAFALQADGWYLRQDIIWHKPNPMPESVRDRCTKAHEYIFLLSKSPKYYYDHEAVKETCIDDGHTARKKQACFGGRDKHKGYGTRIHSGREYVGTSDGKRNKRSVWTVTTKPYKGAHFATFPPDLIEPCILAGAPEGGTVLDPFGGSGTTAGVAIAYGRKAIICELNPEYAGLVDERVAGIVDKMKIDNSQQELF